MRKAPFSERANYKFSVIFFFVCSFSFLNRNHVSYLKFFSAALWGERNLSLHKSIYFLSVPFIACIICSFLASVAASMLKSH